MTSRWTTRILTASMAACLGLGSFAVQAQPGHGHNDSRHGGRHSERGHNDHRNDKRHDKRNDHRYDRHESRNDRHVGHRGAGPDHNWQRGHRVPQQYRSNHYVVNDWRGHHLSAPPRGYQWIQSGGDYLLIAIATGVISSMILGNY